MISVNVSANIQEERRFLSDCKDKTYFYFATQGGSVLCSDLIQQCGHTSPGTGTGQRPNSSLNKDNSVTSRDDGALVLQRYDNILCILHCGVGASCQQRRFTIYYFILLFYSYKARPRVVQSEPCSCPPSEGVYWTDLPWTVHSIESFVIYGGNVGCLTRSSNYLDTWRESELTIKSHSWRPASLGLSSKLDKFYLVSTSFSL